MTHQYILPLRSTEANLASVGGKGASLSRLILADLPVPDGFHITTAAYHRFITENNLEPEIQAIMQTVDSKDIQSFDQASTRIMDLLRHAAIPADIADEAAAAYAVLADNDEAVAVRSSATAEDLPEASFAGQQETYLNVIGTQAVLDAARKCWAALWTARAIAYRARQGISTEGIGLAVVVQRLVPAEASGILFTANPMNGARHQAVINAAWGLGEAVVGGLVTPDTLTIDKLKFRIEKVEIAEKLVRTMRLEKGTEEQAVPKDLQGKPVLTNMQARELTIMGNKIERLYGIPMDIEWALADRKFYILQARPITALPEPELNLGTILDEPDPKAQYMRISICELLPEPVSPLYTTLGLTAINNGITTMLNNMFNMKIDFLDDFITTVNGYAYEKLSLSRRQWFTLIAGMLPGVSRMLRGGVNYWQEIAHPEYLQAASKWSQVDLESRKAETLYEAVNEVMYAFAHHLGSLMASTMGPTAGSEMLFTNVLKRVAPKGSDYDAPTFLMGFNSSPIRSDKALYDLAEWCRRHPALEDHITHTPVEDILATGAEKSPAHEWNEFLKRWQIYLDQHGYAIYDMDFAKTLPKDQPEPLLELLKGYLTGQMKSPYKRQQAYEERRVQAEESIRSRLKGLKRWAFEKTLGWAQRLAPLREDGLAEIGLGYPIVQEMLKELGKRLVQADVILNHEDVYWLEKEELRLLAKNLDAGLPVPVSYHTKVNRRKAKWNAQKKFSPPPKINVGQKFMGFEIDSYLPAEAGNEDDLIKGVPTSPGEVTGTARVLHGPEDFDQMEFGDILVAGITTPAWTPLFAMASAVVTDIGGPLSHGSIVAREYGIPAVLGTGTATRKIRSGQVITVNGNLGTVTIESDSLKGKQIVEAAADEAVETA